VDACFGMMHERDQLAAVRERVEAVAPGGTLVLQYHTLDAILAVAEWNALRLGHYAYYSTPTLIDLLGRVGFRATTAHRFPLYGGTVLLTASRIVDAAAADADEAGIDAVCRGELAGGVLRPEVVGRLQESVGRATTALRELLEQQRAQGLRVYGYGAASRAVSLLCLAGVDATLLTGVADASRAKQGRRMPGTDVPIISPAELVSAAPDTVLVFVPDLLEEARAALPEIEAAGGRWLGAGVNPGL
jgi:hypothetical protein